MHRVGVDCFSHVAKFKLWLSLIPQHSGGNDKGDYLISDSFFLPSPPPPPFQTPWYKASSG